MGISEMREANRKLLAAVDEEIVDGFIQDQVNLVGGCEKFYAILDKSLYQTSIIPFFKEEQKLLVTWREKFFRQNFKSEFLCDPRPSSGKPVNTSLYWFTDGNDDAHCLDTIHYQITQNFDQLMKFAASKVTLDPYRERIYFESYEGHESKKFMYDLDDSDFYDDSLCDEWLDEDYDYCYLVEEGNLAEESEKNYLNPEGYESHWKCEQCESCKEKYLAWKKEEEQKQSENENRSEEFH